jgi:hypothetical protein
VQEKAKAKADAILNRAEDKSYDLVLQAADHSSEAVTALKAAKKLREAPRAMKRQKSATVIPVVGMMDEERRDLRLECVRLAFDVFSLEQKDLAFSIADEIFNWVTETQ